MVHEPVPNYDFPLEKTAATGGWHQASRYSLWIGRQHAGEPAYQLIERHPEGLVRLPLKARLMRLVPAGTPFRVAHLFAPFRASDADLVYLAAAMDDGVYHLLLGATGAEVREDLIIWVCPACGAEMERKTFPTAQYGLNAFWPFLLDEARAFNAAPTRQACTSCGARHPVCYGFDPGFDRPDEAAARAKW